MTNPTPIPGRGSVPDFTLGDRLRKAREIAHMEMQDLATEIDIHRQSVARYESGAAIPKRHVLLSWSMVTGVDLRWIITGSAESTHDEQTTRTTDYEFPVDYEYSTRGNPRFRLMFTSAPD